MIILLDPNSPSDLSHTLATADIDEGFALFDYVRITQKDGKSWIGQIVQPNQNISIVGGRFDPTILHGLNLMNEHPDVKSVESVQVFDILLLGQYDNLQMQTPRLRPLPGARALKLNADEVSHILELPAPKQHPDGSYNCIGELLTADNVPLCITPEILNHHGMLVGGTGAGKSNGGTNIMKQSIEYNKPVLLHDAKPDYEVINRPNSDQKVSHIWPRFAQYGLKPHGAKNVMRIGFYGKCDPECVDRIIAFMASDFTPTALANLFFPGSTPAEQNAFTGFVTAADAVKYRKNSVAYTIDDILGEVKSRDAKVNPQIDPSDAIHTATAENILRKVKARKRGLPWLDAVGTDIGSKFTSRLTSSLDAIRKRKTERFDLESYTQESSLIVADYKYMQEDDEAYALLLTYFLRVGGEYCRKHASNGLLQFVDEAHRIFDNESRHSASLARTFHRAMRQGRSQGHSIFLSLQNASQIPHLVMNNINSHIVMRQNSKEEADAATQTMGKEFSAKSMQLATGQALVKMFESKAVVLIQMAPSPYELQRTDNTGKSSHPLSMGEMEEYDD